MSEANPLQSMVAPGQENLLQEFLAEQGGEEQGAAPAGGDPLDSFLQDSEQGEADGDGLPEKYRGKSAAEVYRLTQLENQYRAEQQGKQEVAATVTPPEFVREQSVNDYGEALTGVFEAAEINPYEIDAKVRAGQEVDAATIDKLVANTGFPKSVVEGYINSFRPAPAAPQGQPLGGEEKAQLVAAIGGPEEAAFVNQWVVANADPTEVEAFNQLVDSGNAAAARAMLKGFAAQAQATRRREPALIGGGAPSEGGLSFADDDEAVAAMQKRDSRGRRLYNTDPKYRKQVDAAMAKSRVFF